MSSFLQNELRGILGKREEFGNAAYIGNACYVPLGEGKKMKAEFVTRGVHNHYEAIRLTVLANEGKVDANTLNFSDYFEKQRLGSGNTVTPHIWFDNGFEWYKTPTAEDIKNIGEAAAGYVTLFTSEELIAQRKELSETKKLIAEFAKNTDDIVLKHGKDAIYTTPSFQCDKTLGCPTFLNVCWEEEKAWLSLPHYVYDDADESKLLTFEKACAQFGLKNCATVEDFNNLLNELGEDAANYCLDETDESENFEQTM